MTDVITEVTANTPATTPTGTQIPVTVQTQQGNYQQQFQTQAQPAPTPVVDTPAPVVTDPTSLIGNSVLETSLNVFASNTGVTADRFMQSIQNALQYNDVNLIDKVSLTQGLKGSQVQQAEALASAMFQNAQQERQNAISTAHQIAGSAEQWQLAIEAFNNSAPAHIKSAARAMEQSGNTREAVEFIVSQAQALGVVNHQQGNLITPSGGTPNTTTALSAVDFQKAVGELSLKAGNQLHAPKSPFSNELKQLQQRRELGKRQGI